jgi:genome maintenance exonuclease 1|tara:strand:+ start:21 stop:686 length:666 start_codon:yes stop_codon:yes gene_type:complete
MFKQSLIDFDSLHRETVDGKRHYVTPEGKKYPSVSTVTGLSTAAGIKKWRQRVGTKEANKISAQASKRGTGIHKLCEDYVSNKDLDFSKVMPDSLMLFKESVKPILDSCLEEVFAVECMLYSDYLQVAGQVDCVGIWKGKPAIIDFKTSSKRKKREWIGNYFMQEAAYAVMFEEMTGIPINRTVTMVVVWTDRSQVFVESRDDHIAMFQQWRGIYKEKYGV